MKTTAKEDVLTRDTDPYVKEKLHLFSNTLEEIINFGTHLLTADIQKKRSGKDNFIPTLFFRNILDIADSISILIKESASDPAKIQLRSLLESCLNLTYMIEEKEKRRGLSYMVWKANKDIKYYNQFLSKEQSSKELIKKVENDDLNLNLEQFHDHQEVLKAKASKKILLQKAEFNDIQFEYLRTKKKFNRRKFNWYSMYDGPINVEKLAKHLKQSSQYEFFYRKYSDNVHGTDLMKGLARSGKGYGQLIQLRDFEHPQEVTTDTISMLLSIYNQFTSKRIPEFKSEFRNWYFNFQEMYNTITGEKHINYKKHID